jgi:inhibitor of cysteine peptidase
MLHIILLKFKSFYFKKLLLTLCVCLLYMTMGGSSLSCNQPNPSNINSELSPMIIRKIDQGQNFEISQGDMVSIQLEENPTTGYQWEIKGIDDQVVALQNSEYISASGGNIGAGGIRIFTFLAKSEGITQVRLVLRRSWESEESAIEHFEVTLRVIQK